MGALAAAEGNTGLAAAGAGAAPAVLSAVIADLGLPGAPGRADALRAVLPPGVVPVLAPGLAGPMGFPRSPAFFPEARARARHLRAGLGEGPVVLILSLPRYAALLRAAAAGDAGGGSGPRRLAALVRAFAAVPRGFPDLVEDLAAGLLPLRTIILPVVPRSPGAGQGAAPELADPLARADLAGRAIADHQQFAAMRGVVFATPRAAGPARAA